MEAADTDGNGTLECDEFVTMSLHLKKMANDEYLASSFSYFDKDGGVFIPLFHTPILLHPHFFVNGSIPDDAPVEAQVPEGSDTGIAVPTDAEEECVSGGG